jgi:tricorn protease
MKFAPFGCVLLSLVLCIPPTPASPVGYYREPAIHGDVIVFVSEGDLWKVSSGGGVATRLTSHPGEEGLPAISPDGLSVAFTAQYEGPTDVYTMPLMRVDEQVR